jgi:starch phosphorylase
MNARFETAPTSLAHAQPDLPPATPAELREAILRKLAYSVGKAPVAARKHDWLEAAILVVRDRVIEKWLKAHERSYQSQSKRVYYLSMEFLIGRLLRDAASNLGLFENLQEALTSLGVDADLVEALEPDAALGNGGLGRLAACFMESMASLGIPAFGYGLRYRHGLFRQIFIDGVQIEMPEDWLAHGNPWEFERRERQYEVGFGGSVEAVIPIKGTPAYKWRPAERLLAIPYDTPICGWRGKMVNTLRLWNAQAVDPIRLDRFNQGDHIGAQTETAQADAITRVLYPSDATPAGQELRLRQEFFFTSASLQDLVRRHVSQYGTVENLADKAAIQLNDTHPAIAIAELMRILIDDHEISWDKAFEITRATTSYTNHTLLPEALESWPVHLMERLLPRHMQIIYAINAGIIGDAHARNMVDFDFLGNISLIDEHNGRRLRMGQLAFAGCHSINGVSALHSELMKQTVFRDLNLLYPGRINNKTNGVTPRRWLQQVNPGLTALISEAIGPRFLDDAEELQALDKFADDSSFQDKFATIRLLNKSELAKLVLPRTGISIDPHAILDVQIKRIHEYKRQLLAILETIACYNEIRANPSRTAIPRVKLFAGKAAASYWDAKTIIRLINDVSRVINSDPLARGKLQVAFVPNYNVSLAESIVPAADISEQISTAGMEASGTGNMKLALNGAITIGTLDGANVEIRDHVGHDNFFLFGLTAAEVMKRRQEGHNPGAIVEQTPHLHQVLDAISSGVFSPGEPDRYADLVRRLLESDWFMVTADFADYCAAVARAERLWHDDRRAWLRMSIRNTARMGWFSSDRTIRQYAGEIWNALPAG